MSNKIFNNDVQLISAMLAPSMRDIFIDNSRLLKKFMNKDTIDIFLDIEKSMPRNVTPEGLKTILELKKIEDIDLIINSYSLAYKEDTKKLVYDSAREALYRVYLNSIKGNSIDLINSIKSNELFFPEYGIMNSEYSRTVKFGDLAINQSNSELGNSFKSSFDFINNLTPNGGGYYQDQVIVITSPPGSGKSLFCMNEAIAACKQGMKVHYTALGDLSEFDFMSRPASILLNVPMMKVLCGLNKSFTDILSKYPYMNNLTINFVSPGVFSVNEWIDNLKHSGELEKNDVFIVDYDSNFKSNSDNIYLKGDEIYTSLELLAKTYHKIVISVAQPKVNSWGKSIDLTSLSESSRKQHHSDIIITLAPQYDISNTCNVIGELSIVKNRRGSTGKTKYFREPTGRFSEITRSLYSAAQSSNEILYYKPFEGCESDPVYTKLDVPDIIEDINNIKKDELNDD